MLAHGRLFKRSLKAFDIPFIFCFVFVFWFGLVYFLFGIFECLEYVRNWWTNYSYNNIIEIQKSVENFWTQKKTHADAILYLDALSRERGLRCLNICRTDHVKKFNE